MPQNREYPRTAHSLVWSSAKGSLAAAAEAMSLSPSAASRLVTLLEAETRLQLFQSHAPAP